ncbi:acetylornithine aminotransferase [Coemansia sp. RSA 2523]|nr:acetylornithine aminotransferase [Coemansia sp. RSA 1591]KAJ1764087.1 acetylornithine aminotransferase [Coemansia sp. RSA 1752]KAJ1778988.1 acetylornithine aminotransferase [Coemansia sp. RSA 1824]KAJ1790771.1 acetylornithine aminotransferase [Coemansia sp. RSA 1938]KAJ1790995.1 acetylornithine aminotransferase [Coemansia sp. RSA 2167]KAJ1809198.1 acetylornithine aminotransferase [Coemansia sp. RSA 2523]KAJ2154499.1 acetylornithine aminotransferase [Coemansia sp. RSA 637]KAJ2428801.1 acet
MSAALKYQGTRLLAASSRLSILQKAAKPSLLRGYHATSARLGVAHSGSQTVANAEKYTLNTYARPTLVLSHGKGSYLYDTDGKEYLDFTAGIAVVALGHNHPDITAAVVDQASKLVHCSNLYHNEWAPQLARNIVESTIAAYPQGTQGIYAQAADGRSPARVFFSNSGTEANEGALKFARKYGKHVAELGTLGKGTSEALRGDPNLKCGIVSFTGGFHGRSMGALSVTANPKYQKPFTPLIPGVQTAKYNSTSEIGAFVDERTCGVIVEPIQGEGGIHPAQVDFLRALRRRCDQVGALLIYDEIQCGLGRSGKLWAHQLYPEDCSPDILTMAKPLANGIPIGAILVSDKVAELIKVGEHGTTFGGNPLACRVGCTVLDHIAKPEFLEHVQNAGQVLEQELQQALAPFVGSTVVELRGTGLLRGIQFASDPTEIVDLARDRGLMLVGAGGNTVRLVPPLNTSIADIKRGAAIIADCVKQFAAERKA